MKKKNFIKKKEDFGCLVCGTKVKGTGYTNHCPKCLYSFHIDKETPGDRSSACFGLMKPIGVEIKGSKYVIAHECQKCGKKTKNKASKEDNIAKIINISKNTV